MFIVTFMFMYMYNHICISIYTCMYIYVCMYVCMCIYIYIYVCVYIYIYIYTYSCARGWVARPPPRGPSQKLVWVAAAEELTLICAMNIIIVYVLTYCYNGII